MSITITTATSSRVIDAYRVLSDPGEYELRGESNRAGNLVTKGDEGQRPAPLEVEVSFQEATFPETVRLATLVIEEATLATSVTLPRGIRTVDGILEHTLTSTGPEVIVRLWFAPAGGDYS